jgi:hypothetical protein
MLGQRVSEAVRAAIRDSNVQTPGEGLPYPFRIATVGQKVRQAVPLHDPGVAGILRVEPLASEPKVAGRWVSATQRYALPAIMALPTKSSGGNSEASDLAF